MGGDASRALNVCNAMSAKVMRNFESEVLQVIEKQEQGMGVGDVTCAMRFRHSGVSDKVVFGALKTLVVNGKVSESQGVFCLRR